MWIFTKLADWFDKTREDNDRWVDSQLQPWVATTLYDDSPWYRNVGVWTASGVLYALNKFTTTVASGFVDVLRLGDGVQEGGWGYGKDALRLLMVVGPALKAVRYAGPLARGLGALAPELRATRWSLSLVQAVDVSGGTSGNCAWVAAARLLRLTGARPLAELGDVARWSGLAASETGGIGSVGELVPALRNLGADARAVNLGAEAKAANLFGRGAASTSQALAKVAAANPNGAVMFGVRWMSRGRTVGHALIAVRDTFGGITIIDRLGGTVKSLAELERFYPGISGAVVDAEAVVAENSVVVKSLGTVPTLAEVVSQAAPGGHGAGTAGGGGGGGGGGSAGQVAWLNRLTGLVFVALDPTTPQTPQELVDEINDALKPGEPKATVQQVTASLRDLQARGAARMAGGGWVRAPGFQPVYGQPNARK
jgi:hypothetical protein